MLTNTNMSCSIGSSEQFCRTTQYCTSDFTCEDTEAGVQQAALAHQVSALESGCTRTELQVPWVKPTVLSALLPSVQKTIG